MVEAVSDMREKQLNIRLNEEEQDRLGALCKHYGLNASAVFRMLVKRDFDQIEASRRGDQQAELRGKKKS